MIARVIWRGHEWQRAFNAHGNEAVSRAAAYIADRASQNIGSEGGGALVPGKDVAVSARSRALISARGGRIVRNLGSRQLNRLIGLTSSRRQRFVAAPPGAYPGYRTGTLARSIRWVRPETLGTPMRAAVGSNLTYARYLEFGTSRMAARPWLMRSALEARTGAAAVFAATLRASLKAEGRIET